MGTLKKCLRNKTFVVCAIVLVPILLCAVFGPAIVPHDPYENDGSQVLQGMSREHPLGTDQFGRDILSRLIIGIRPTVTVALGAAAIALAAGVLMGILAGYFGGVAEQLLMRTVDLIVCVPPIMIALTAVAFWGAGISNLIVIIGIVYIPSFARISYASTLQVKKREFIESDISLGASTLRILTKGIFPNITSPLIIQISLTVASAILLESGLSFLGLGVVPPTPSWGGMIGDAKRYLTTNPLYIFWPSLFLVLTILAVNLLGDSLRDILDPRFKNEM